ncbi:hypothetical protein [Acidipropionibacterium jensenii]|uniref:hypothetical protein n=1 Tax=Acidipropionibacterium jensenii TaxID=1749 RepID=UPI00048AF28B|nr:hypothetical protein [Acidipropionibacterium jensenii]
MSGQMSGVVVSVESARQGVIATSWSGKLLSVWNAADVDRDGCDLTPDDGVTRYHATGEVAEGLTDDDPDVVTMADTAPADWPAGGTDDDGQPIPTDTRLDLWPEVLDVVAQVDTGDDDLLPVAVPHALRPLLSEGLRDEGGGEQVICEARGTGWVIVDVIGRRGEIGLDGLGDDVTGAIDDASQVGADARTAADAAQQVADQAQSAASTAQSAASAAQSRADAAKQAADAAAATAGTSSQQAQDAAAAASTAQQIANAAKANAATAQSAADAAQQSADGAASAAASAQSSANANASDLASFTTTVNAKFTDVQSQIDGSIATWFYPVPPTNTNTPASSWTTTDIQNNHLGDLYYDTNSGYCYRWQIASQAYSWQRITDVDVTKALADAAKAQDTADGKRRVFTATPVPPYDVGDLWAGGPSGELMRCKVAKTSAQSYAAGDWEKASKYTDDTAADQAKAAADAAQSAADAAAAKAGTAQASADGKNVVKHSTAPATGSSGTPGDMWFQHQTDPSNAGSLAMPVLAWWMWSGTAWISQQLTGAVLTALDAGTITVGALSGINIFSPGAGLLPRTQIVGSTISVIRAGAEGEEVTTVQLGGADDDQLMISDTDGSPLGGIDPEGNVLAQDLSVNGDLTVGGVALPDMLSPLPQGIIARQKLGSTSALNSIYVGGTELGLLELSADLHAGREYEFFVGGNVKTSAAGIVSLRVRATTAALGSTPAAPAIPSPGLLTAVIPCQSGNQEITWSKILPVQASDVSARILLTAQTSSASMSLRFNTSDTLTSDIMITDRGSYGSWGDGAVSNGGGTPFSGTSTNPSSTNPTRTYTKSWKVAATRTWRNGSVVSGKLMQGYYSPGQRYGLWLWDGSIAATVGSNANIQSCILTVKNVDFPTTPGRNGILRIGHYDSTALPGSPQTSGGSAVSVSMKAGRTAKIGLPGGWWVGIATGAIRGITIGEVGSGAANKPTYGHFEPSATITMTYTK